MVYHLGDRVHPLRVSEGVNTIAGAVAGTRTRYSADDPVKKSRMHNLCGIYQEDSF